MEPAQSIEVLVGGLTFRSREIPFYPQDPKLLAEKPRSDFTYLVSRGKISFRGSRRSASASKMRALAASESAIDSTLPAMSARSVIARQTLRSDRYHGSLPLQVSDFRPMMAELEMIRQRTGTRRISWPNLATWTGLWGRWQEGAPPRRRAWSR